MNDPRLDYANEFPVELTAPDISSYKKTNTESIIYYHLIAV